MSDSVDKGSSPLTRGKLAQLVHSVVRVRLIPAHAGKTSVVTGPSPPGAAHPRSRGENGSQESRDRRRRGSSPLTRGKLYLLSLDFNTPRLIPAHAGKTQTVYKQISQWSAHPRSRGENLAGRRATSPDLGSSPLTRGKPSLAEVLPQDARLIPAHAGKTYGRVHRGPVAPAHPRSRGENTRADARYLHGRGSSPLTRGKPRVGGRRRESIRLIPAHAGKT